MKNVILAVAMFALVGQLAAQRKILLLHGNSNAIGSVNSWEVYRQHFVDSRNSLDPIHVKKIVYGTPGGLASATSNALADIIDKTPDNTQSDNPNNIAFGSSMGGLVLRKLEKDGNAAKFGGYITCGTPNGGMKIANSFLNGDLQDFFEQGCEQVVTQPFGGLSNVISTLSNEPFFSIDGILCNMSVHQFLSDDSNGFLSNSVATDLSVGSAAITSLNSFTSAKPHINVWGNEQSPVHWRMLGSKIDISPPGVNILTTTPSLLPLNQEGSNFLCNTMIAAEAMEYFAAVELGVGAVVTGVAGFWDPQLWLMTAAFGYSSVQFYQGADWLHDSETEWNLLIGADDGVVTQSYQIPMLTSYCASMIQQNGYAWYYGELTTAEQNACYEITTINTTVPASGKSDGLVTEGSAKMPGACEIEVEKANHWELLNHENSTHAYDGILDGDLCGSATGFFFQTQ